MQGQVPEHQDRRMGHQPREPERKDREGDQHHHPARHEKHRGSRQEQIAAIVGSNPAPVPQGQEPIQVQVEERPHTAPQERGQPGGGLELPIREIRPR